MGPRCCLASRFFELVTDSLRSTAVWYISWIDVECDHNRWLAMGRGCCLASEFFGILWQFSGLFKKKTDPMMGSHFSIASKPSDFCWKLWIISAMKWCRDYANEGWGRPGMLFSLRPSPLILHAAQGCRIKRGVFHWERAPDAKLLDRVMQPMNPPRANQRILGGCTTQSLHSQSINMIKGINGELFTHRRLHNSN